MKVCALLTIFLVFQIHAETVGVKLAFEKFHPTAFGIKSRTIDIKDAEAVLKSLKEFQQKNPHEKISRIEILTCTSDYPLPKSTLTLKAEGEHLHLAKQRHELILNELQKHYKVTFLGEARICGPQFKREDLNDRFIVPESGNLFVEKLKAMGEDEDLVRDLKEIALTNLEDASRKYQSLFQAKYRSFQGIRLKVFIHVDQERKIPSQDKIQSPSIKVQ